MKVLFGEFADRQGSGGVTGGGVDRLARVMVGDQAGVAAMGLGRPVDTEIAAAAVEADVRLVRGLVVEVAGLSSGSLSGAIVGTGAWSGHVVSKARVVDYALRGDAAPTNIVG